MTDDGFNFDDEDDQQFNESEGIKNLRAQAKKLAKANAELQAQLTEALAATRRTTVNETLRSLGANPKIAKYIPTNVEPTEDAIKAWLKEDGEIFGYKGPEAQGEGNDKGQAENGAQTGAQAQSWANPQGWNPAAPIPPGLVEAFGRVQNPDSFGGVQTPTGDAQALAQMKALADQAKGDFFAFEDLHRRLNG